MGSYSLCINTEPGFMVALKDISYMFMNDSSESKKLLAVFRGFSFFFVLSLFIFTAKVIVSGKSHMLTHWLKV